MKKTHYLFTISILCILFFAACGPTEAEIATMTAAAWTPTPLPTPTPTPVPYDMEVSLTGEGGENITFGVYIQVAEEDEVMMGESGKVEFLNLSGPEVEVNITAQGYEPHSETVTLERGKNPVTFTLTADPLQINPATACSDGQKVLMIEDFEDKEMQGWEGQLVRPLFDFVEIEGRGTVLKVDRTIEGEVYLKYPQIIGNMAWHYDILREPGNGPMWMRFHQEEGKGAYIGTVDGGIGFGLEREPGQSLGDRYVQESDGNTWEKFTLVYFDGTVETWINDELFIGATDADPYPDGFISIAMKPSNGSTHLDNLIVCELTEPYAPPAVEE
jgi:hypothetical protein